MESGVDIGAAAGDLGYGKGALVLSMLEQLIGTQSLLESIQEWIKTHPKGEPGEWEGFESVVLKKNPASDLKGFFNDWFRRPGYADVQLVAPTYASGTFRASLKWNGNRFRMPLELWFENSVGTRQRLTFDTEKANNEGSIEIKMPDFRPVKVYLDPWHKALRVGIAPIFGSFREASSRMKVYRDPNQASYCSVFTATASALPLDLNNIMLIGHPDTEPRLKALCAKAGFAVLGNNLTYKGTTIDLARAAAFAVVDLGEGKKCAIGLGTCKREPNLGNANAGLVEPLGRFLRGETVFPSNVQPIVVSK
jgi:hypothetical protein